MIRVFAAFSGIGGFRSSFERVVGFKTVGWCEIDRFAQKSYRALFDTGGEQFYANIRDIDTAGNAVTVNVAEALTRNLLKFDADMNETKYIRM